MIKYWPSLDKQVKWRKLWIGLRFPQSDIIVIFLIGIDILNPLWVWYLPISKVAQNHVFSLKTRKLQQNDSINPGYTSIDIYGPISPINVEKIENYQKKPNLHFSIFFNAHFIQNPPWLWYLP